MSNLEACIVGVGTAGIFRHATTSAVGLADVAVAEALDDCGLDRSAIDGLLVQIGSPRGADYDTLARLLSIRVRFASQTWSHGRFMATVIQHGALALSHGLADFVLCIGAFRSTAFGNHGTTTFPDFGEAIRDGGGPHSEDLAAGLAAPIGGAAMVTRQYLHKYGIDPSALRVIAQAQREHASRNALAIKKDLISDEDYDNASYVVEPLRVLDCSIPVDTAVAVVLTTHDRAVGLPQCPVRLLSFQGLSGGPQEYVFGPPGLGVNQVLNEADPPVNRRVFERADLTRGDIDMLHCYDGFTPQVLWTLERFGFAPAGEAAGWITQEGIGIDAELPINTSGGNLSEGHTNGWGHLREIVLQLRGAAGTRQVVGCRTAMWATTFGDAIIYGN
jgi:acetyl-CoA acetyltransferase